MKSPSAAPERILVTGIFGSGKSETWVQTAAAYRDTDTPGTFYVVNTDVAGTIERCNERWPAWESNIQFVNVDDWDSLAQATNLYAQIATKDDWIIVDSADKAWTWIRDLYDYKAAEAKGTLPAAGDWFGVIEEVDDRGKWDPINAAYGRWILPLIQKCPAHILMTAPAQMLKVPTGKEKEWVDDKALRVEFGKFGVRPAGQKHLSYQLHTVLFAEHTKPGYTLTTLKDRSREPMDGTVITPTMSFPVAYLIGVANWQD